MVENKIFGMKYLERSETSQYGSEDAIFAAIRCSYKKYQPTAVGSHRSVRSDNLKLSL